ncbi:ABC transporter transmembrane domain-containing protein [Halodesulfovibrio sp.]|jgi:subfamily B ATP-binding cassette protein MsbA|uniref:ABC transporter ATP-binding protein n=1 Tax=Halodesulfovibrio sp. TaxID=1912772 RepID=UPI0025E809B8|nr:ABC transporter transmembrane domain-containing protein [Halodesulfovibrio sp.]MCT4534864.1 ABC transporter transmembrane domain-containing protein [Halodesulfovibrio sp.]MCT4627823.1 ABC transporter transmembrane domain-containing protein [Halodesulfovibrio sp.]
MAKFKKLPKNSAKLLKRTLRYFVPYKLSILISLIAMAVVAATTGASAYLIKPALDDIFINKNSDYLLLIPFAYFILVLAKGAGRYSQNYFMTYCGLKVLEKLRNELFDKIICLPLKFYEEQQVGMLMSRVVNDVAEIRGSLPAVIKGIRQFLTMIGLLFVVFYQDSYLATWAVLVLPLALFPFIHFGRKLRKLGKKNQVLISAMTIFLQEKFSGIRVVKAFANEEGEKAGFRVENSRIARLALKQTIVGQMSSPIMELIGALGIGLVIWYGGSQVIAGEQTAGTFFSFVAALIMLYDPVKELTSANNSLQKALAGAERVFEILDSPDIVVEQDGTQQIDGVHEVAFEDVTFSYDETGQPALKDINITIKEGEKVAIVGPSGAGKTTFVNLVPRFYEQQQGRILINGVDSRSLTLKSLRKNVAIVSQDAFLFDTSIADNIAYSSENSSREAIEEAAKAAFAHDFITEFPDGYDTVVGERGVRLSGGQKQRLTIARALLKNAPLLILDEATSALDSESEKVVQKALENLMKDRTSLVIAHRLSTIISADRILVMKNGEVVDEGTHESLLANSMLYQRLYTLQFESHEELA